MIPGRIPGMCKIGFYDPEIFDLHFYILSGFKTAQDAFQRMLAFYIIMDQPCSSYDELQYSLDNIAKALFPEGVNRLGFNNIIVELTSPTTSDCSSHIDVLKTSIIQWIELPISKIIEFIYSDFYIAAALTFKHLNNVNEHYSHNAACLSVFEDHQFLGLGRFTEMADRLSVLIDSYFIDLEKSDLFEHSLAYMFNAGERPCGPCEFVQRSQMLSTLTF